MEDNIENQGLNNNSQEFDNNNNVKEQQLDEQVNSIQDGNQGKETFDSGEDQLDQSVQHQQDNELNKSEINRHQLNSNKNHSNSQQKQQNQESQELLIKLKKSKQDYQVLMNQKKNISELEKKSLQATIKGIEDQIRLLEEHSSGNESQFIQNNSQLSQQREKRNNSIDRTQKIDHQQLFKIMFIHYGKKGAKTYIQTFGNLEAQQNTWDIHKYSMFLKDFGLNVKLSKQQVKSMFMKNLSQNNEMQIEQFLKFIEQIQETIFQGNLEEMLDYLGINDNSYLKKLGFPDFITDITKVYVKQKKQVIDISPDKKKSLYPEPSAEQQQKIKKQPKQKNNVQSKNTKNLKEIQNPYMPDIISWDVLNFNKQFKTIDRNFDEIKNLIGNDQDNEDDFYLQQYSLKKQGKGSSPQLKQKQAIQYQDNLHNQQQYNNQLNINSKLQSQESDNLQYNNNNHQQSQHIQQQYQSSIQSPKSYNSPRLQTLPQINSDGSGKIIKHLQQQNIRVGKQGAEGQLNQIQRSLDIPPQKYYQNDNQQKYNSNNHMIPVPQKKVLNLNSNRSQIVGSNPSSPNQLINNVQQIPYNNKNGKIMNKILNISDNSHIINQIQNNQIQNQNNKHKQQQYLIPNIDTRQQQILLNNQKNVINSTQNVNNSSINNQPRAVYLSKKDNINQQDKFQVNKYMMPRKLSLHNQHYQGQQNLNEKQNYSNDVSYIDSISGKQQNQNQIVNRAQQIQQIQLQKEKEQLRRVYEQGKQRQLEQSPGQKVLNKYKQQ